MSGRLPVFDGGDNLYTAGLLPFTSKEFKISFGADEDEETNNIR